MNEREKDALLLMLWCHLQEEKDRSVGAQPEFWINKDKLPDSYEAESMEAPW